MTAIIVDSAALESVCRRHRIVRLALFGSHLRGTAGPDSDLDLLVEFEPGHVPGFGFVAVERELSEARARSRPSVFPRKSVYRRLRMTQSSRSGFFLPMTNGERCTSRTPAAASREAGR